MSGDYINREAAISALRLVEVRESSYNFPAGMLSELKSIPAADVVEVRHGRWINEHQEGLGSFSAECSLCGKRTLAYFHYFYCPSCGAKMDGGQHE